MRASNAAFLSLKHPCTALSAASIAKNLQESIVLKSLAGQGYTATSSIPSRATVAIASGFVPHVEQIWDVGKALRCSKITTCTTKHLQILADKILTDSSPIVFFPLPSGTCRTPDLSIDVVFPPRLLSALSSSPFHCALQDGLVRPDERET